MINLNDDLSLSDLLKTIDKHYFFSYEEIMKEATALNHHVVSTLVISK